MYGKSCRWHCSKTKSSAFPIFFFFERRFYYGCFQRTSCLCENTECGKVKQFLVTGSVLHHIDTVTMQLVLQGKWCCEKEGWWVIHRSRCTESSESVKFHKKRTVFNKHDLHFHCSKYFHMSDQEMVLPQGNSFHQRLSGKMQEGVVI